MLAEAFSEFLEKLIRILKSFLPMGYVHREYQPLNSVGRLPPTHTASNFGELLTKAEDGDITLETLFDEMFLLEEQINFTLADRLFEFLACNDNLAATVALLTKIIPSTDESDTSLVQYRDKRLRYASVASNVLIYGPQKIRLSVACRENVVDLLLNYYDNPPPLDSEHVNHVSKVVVSLLNDLTDNMLNHIKRKANFLSSLVQHIRHTSVGSIISQLVADRAAYDFGNPSFDPSFVAALPILENGKIFAQLSSSYIKSLTNLVTKPNSAVYMEELEHATQIYSTVSMRITRGLKFGSTSTSMSSLNVIRNFDSILAMMDATFDVLTNKEKYPVGLHALYHLLQMLIEILNSIYEERDQHTHMSRSSKEFDTTSLENLLAQKFPLLLNILMDDLHPGLTNSNSNFGAARLKVAEMFVLCTKSCSPDIAKNIMSLGLVDIFLDLLQTNKANSILHTLIELFIENSLLLEKSSVRHLLLKEYRITGKILQLWELEDTEWNNLSNDSTAYYSALLHIACCIQEYINRTKNKSIPEDALNYIDEDDYKKFAEFEEKLLRSIMIEESKELGGTKPGRNLPFGSLFVDPKRKPDGKKSNQGDPTPAHRFNKPAKRISSFGNALDKIGMSAADRL